MKYYIMPVECHVSWRHRVEDDPCQAELTKARLERETGAEWRIQYDSDCYQDL